MLIYEALHYLTAFLLRTDPHGITAQGYQTVFVCKACPVTSKKGNYLTSFSGHTLLLTGPWL